MTAPTQVEARDAFNNRPLVSIAAVEAELDALREALKRIVALPGADGEVESWKMHQSMRLNEQCRAIARAALASVERR